MHNEESKEKEFMEDLFNCISPRYDIANKIISFGMEIIWRRKFLNFLFYSLQENQNKIIDVCCGTGTSSFQVYKKISGSSVWGVDFSSSMLCVAGKKFSKYSGLKFIKSEAEKLDFKDNYFDCVTISFGIRNIINREAALKEFFRVAKKNGKLFILEFGNIDRGVFAKLYNWYLDSVLPVTGGIISGNRSAYFHLSDSIHKFPEVKEFIKLVNSCGWETESVKPLTFGVCNIYIAVKK